jgi:hypothetical protein
MAVVQQLVAGLKKWVTAITSSAGSGDAAKLVATDVNGKIDITFFPGGLSNSIIAVASEDLPAGCPINLFDATGTPKLRKADATSAAKRCHGFTQQAFLTGVSATAFRDGEITGLTGLTDGAEYYLSTTAGALVTDVSGYTTSGMLIQHLGVAHGTTVLALGIDFDPSQIA